MRWEEGGRDDEIVGYAISFLIFKMYVKTNKNMMKYIKHVKCDATRVIKSDNWEGRRG